ncbi:hypothetical protein STAL104432_09390 [Streptomyces albus]
MAVAGVALSAATGCMTVSGDPGSPGRGPSSHHSPASEHGEAPRREGRSPARDSLPPGGAGKDADRRGDAGAGNGNAPHTRKEAPAPDGPAARPGAGTAPRQAPLPRTRRQPPHGTQPGQPGGRHGPEDGGGARERHGRGLGPGTDPRLCELGRAWGRWDADSAEARLCRSAYGR